MKGIDAARSATYRSFTDPENIAAEILALTIRDVFSVPQNGVEISVFEDGYTITSEVDWISPHLEGKKIESVFDVLIPYRNIPNTFRSEGLIGAWYQNICVVTDNRRHYTIKGVLLKLRMFFTELQNNTKSKGIP